MFKADEALTSPALLIRSCMCKSLERHGKHWRRAVTTKTAEPRKPIYVYIYNPFCMVAKLLTWILEVKWLVSEHPATYPQLSNHFQSIMQTKQLQNQLNNKATNTNRIECAEPGRKTSKTWASGSVFCRWLWLVCLVCWLRFGVWLVVVAVVVRVGVVTLLAAVCSSWIVVCEGGSFDVGG